MRCALLAGLVVAASSACVAQPLTVVVGFESGNVPGGWSFGGPDEGVVLAGGNPGAYWRTLGLDTFAPILRTEAGVEAPPFTGDYWRSRVRSVGVDLILTRVDFSAAGRPLSLILVSDNGTPGDGSDDYGAYVLGTTNVPLVGEGWRRYEFAIPAGRVGLPPGWSMIAFGPNAPANPTWDDVVLGVDGVRFFFGNPENIFIFQTWDVGADNVFITLDAGCLADVDDGSGTGTRDGGVEISDLLYYLVLFGAGNLRADVDDGTGTGTPDNGVDVSDLLYYLARFEAGC